VNIGCQLVAPEGFATLKKGHRYSFLKNDRETGWVTLIEFTTQTKGRRVKVHRISSDQFLRAIDPGNLGGKRLVVAEVQMSLPPWLANIEGSDLDEIDLNRVGAVKAHRERAEKKYGHIAQLLPKMLEILRSKNPFSIINKHAEESQPKQNRTRLAEWFFAYVCFGEKLIALYPEYPNIGIYDKSDPQYFDSPWGRPSADKGKHYGWPSAMFTAQIEKSVRARLALGNTKTAIYEDALKEDWGCRSRMNERGDWEFYHPEGKPFPDTYGKFWYAWHKIVDIRQTNTSLYGEYRMRSKAGSIGSYAEEIGTLLSDVEVDAYYLGELPKLARGAENSKRLCVARAVCIASKNVIGVGFSFENETADAYRTMLFSAAIGLEKFAELWGLSAGVLLDAPLKGLPSHLISDRGKAPIAAILKNMSIKFPVKELAPTYSGQSKASVESGHPRDVHIDGPPTYVVSDKNVIQLIQREICTAALDNHRSYVGGLIIGSRATSETVASPYALGQLLDRQGLNDSISISFEDAARAFLLPVKYELRDGGFWYETRCYSSDEIEEADIYRDLNPGQTIKVNGYQLPMNLMWAWIEFRGKLIQLKQKMPFRMGEHEKMLSSEEIKREVELKRALDAEHRRSAKAAEVEARARYEATTGARWGGGSRKSGRPRKSDDASVEKTILSPKSPRSRRNAA